ncbi:RES domain-containing protein [bacterium]|nr:RES domain-containing protein [bacterium]
MNLNVFHDKALKIPINYAGNIINQLDKQYKKYFDFLETNKNHELFKEVWKEIRTIRNISKVIIKSIEYFYHGKKNEGYRGVKHIFDKYQHHAAYLLKPVTGPLFRIRISSNYSLDICDLLHIPFEKRYLISNQRYSISGIPCLYLGSSMYVCWEEMARPNFNDIHCICLVPKETISILDFSKTPLDYIKDFDLRNRPSENGIPPEEIKYAISYFIFFPLIISCCLIPQYRNSTFFPEYIIPQYLMEYLIHSDIDGVSYTSVRKNSENSDSRLCANYAFPSKTPKKKGIDRKLMEKFYTTTPYSYYCSFLETMHFKSTPSRRDNQGWRLYLTSNTGAAHYEFTEFHLFESFMIEKYRRDKYYLNRQTWKKALEGVNK